jgi:hypothetical protein
MKLTEKPIRIIFEEGMSHEKAAEFGKYVEVSKRVVNV